MSVFHSLWVIWENSFSCVGGIFYSLVRCLLSFFNGYIVVYVSAWNIFPSSLLLKSSVCADFSFDLIVFANLCTLIRRKFFAIFSFAHTHKILQYILVDGTRVLFSVLLLHLYFFLLNWLLLLSSTKLNKGDRAEVFLVVVMVAMVLVWYIVCDSKCLSFFARYSSSSSFIHLSWLYNSLVILRTYVLTWVYVFGVWAHPFTSMLDLILAIK